MHNEVTRELAELTVKLKTAYGGQAVATMKALLNELSSSSQGGANDNDSDAYGSHIRDILTY